MNISRSSPLRVASQILPPSSYHSTIFSGANDQERQAHVWPDDIPLNTPIEECNRLIEAKLRSARFSLSLPLRFRIDCDPETQALDASTSSILLVPFDEAENRKVRELRDKLSEVLKIHSADHEAYRFHITLGYWVQSVTPAELENYHKSISEALAQLTSEIRSIDLHVPQYCTLENMLSYSPRGPLNVIPPGESAHI